MTSITATIIRPIEPTTNGRAPSADDIRAALAKLLDQPALKRSRQLSAFLTYVVETALAGRAATIKSYTIACDALGRDENFDPLTDPIVRVGAGRLRRILDAYYAGDGADDPVRIELPRGRYVPRFVVTAPQAPPPADAMPPPNAAPIAMSIAVGVVIFGAAMALLASDIGAVERVTMIAALLMGLHALTGGRQFNPGTHQRQLADRPATPAVARRDDAARHAAMVRAEAAARQVAASGAAARR